MAKNWAAKQSPRDWGRYTGRTGFEVGLMFTGVGEAKAVVSGAEGLTYLPKLQKVPMYWLKRLRLQELQK